jgi:glutathione S-transferase
MVSYEKASKAVLGLGSPDPAFIARGEQNFARFATVLNDSLAGKTWLVGERLTIADFSVGVVVTSADHMGLPIGDYPEITRWCKRLSALPGWSSNYPVFADSRILRGSAHCLSMRWPKKSSLHQMA